MARVGLNTSRRPATSPSIHPGLDNYEASRPSTRSTARDGLLKGRNASAARTILQAAQATCLPEARRVIRVVKGQRPEQIADNTTMLHTGTCQPGSCRAATAATAGLQSASEACIGQWCRAPGDFLGVLTSSPGGDHVGCVDHSGRHLR